MKEGENNGVENNGVRGWTFYTGEKSGVREEKSGVRGWTFYTLGRKEKRVKRVQDIDTPNGTQTYNRLFRSQTPYILGHGHFSLCDHIKHFSLCELKKWISPCSRKLHNKSVTKRGLKSIISGHIWLKIVAKGVFFLLFFFYYHCGWLRGQTSFSSRTIFEPPLVSSPLSSGLRTGLWNPVSD